MVYFEKWKEYIAILVLFTILTIILTYPLAINMNNRVSGPDAAGAVWLLAWDVYSITNDPLNLFNANVFYPFENSLALSDHHIIDSLIASPFILLFHNPVLGYNMASFLSFIISGLGMYLLVYYYTKNKYAALVSAILFSFNPFRFTHFGGHELMTAQWMPFAVLYLDKFIKDNTYKSLIAFNVFFVLQILSYWYIAFYTIILISLYILYQFISKIEIRNQFFHRDFQIKIIFFIIITAFVMLPFTFPYIELRNNYGFTRTIQETEYFSADIVDYMFTTPSNFLYGELAKTRGNIKGAEQSLFLGFTTIFLSVYALLPLFRHPLKEYKFYHNQIFYIILVIISFILTLGPRLYINGYRTDIVLPYNYLYYLPGFNSMRVPSRFIILAIFGLSILSGYGTLKIINNFEKKYGGNKKYIPTIIIAFLILIESIYIPIGNSYIPTGNSTPEVYKWLANEKGNFAIVELPTGYFTRDGNNLWYDAKYMYYSTYHWKKLVNGYSGFFPDGYVQILNQLQEFPSETSINLLKGIPVKYIIIHSSEIDQQKWSRILNNYSKYNDLKIIKIFGSDYVFQVESSRDALQKKDIPLINFNAPSITGTDNRFTFSISLFNDKNYTYIGQPKLIIDVKFIQKNNPSTVSIIKLRRQVIINPYETVNIPMMMKSPSSPGDYIMNVTIKHEGESYEKTFQNPIIVKEHVLDSISSDRVHALYNSYNIPKVVIAGTKFKVNINVTNDGKVLWKAISTSGSIGEVRMGNSWLKEDVSTWVSERGLIPYDVAPGQNATIEMFITAPKIPGKYMLKLDLVDEGVVWFEQQGAKPIEQVIDVIQ